MRGESAGEVVSDFIALPNSVAQALFVAYLWKFKGWALAGQTRLQLRTYVTDVVTKTWTGYVQTEARLASKTDTVNPACTASFLTYRWSADSLKDLHIHAGAVWLTLSGNHQWTISRPLKALWLATFGATFWTSYVFGSAF